MKRKLILMLLVASPLIGGCTQYKKLIGQDSSHDAPAAGPHLIAAVGLLPGSNVLTVTPSFTATDTLQTVRIRIAGVLTTISDTPSASEYYSFDGTTFTVYNYNAAANLGGFSDNFAIYFVSSFPAGYHSWQ